jgi:hypothetical protein
MRVRPEQVRSNFLEPSQFNALYDAEVLVVCDHDPSSVKKSRRRDDGVSYGYFR